MLPRRRVLLKPRHDGGGRAKTPMVQPWVGRRIQLRQVGGIVGTLRTKRKWCSDGEFAAVCAVRCFDGKRMRLGRLWAAWLPLTLVSCHSQIESARDPGAHSSIDSGAASVGAVDSGHQEKWVPSHHFRVIRPLNAGDQECLEMYSACSGPASDQRCTSASLWIHCGERTVVPGTNEQLGCVCP